MHQPSAVRPHVGAAQGRRSPPDCNSQAEGVLLLAAASKYSQSPLLQTLDSSHPASTCCSTTNHYVSRAFCTACSASPVRRTMVDSTAPGQY